MYILNDLLSSIKNIIIANCADEKVKVCGVCNDSRKSKKNFIFVAIDGALQDGHKYIPQAIANCANVIVYENDLSEFEEGIQYIKVKSAYAVYALLSEAFLGYPTKKLGLIGITGTNGKTTTAFIVKQLLKHKSGLISTILYDDGNKTISASRTTPEAYELQSFFQKMNKNNCEYAIMEVSSHSLVQNRIASGKFKVAIFSNLTGDHLDYHKSMENYYQAKKLLFTKHLANDGFAIINTDDKYGENLHSEIKDSLSLGTDKENDFFIKFIKADSQKTTFSLTIKQAKKLTITTNLIGKYNIYNLSSAVATCALIDDIDSYNLENEILHFDIPGRLNQIQTKTASFFIDYAHTDDALENVLQTLAQVAKKRIITIFGCGGDRDKSKRARMGKIAEKYSDIIILTSDNPRTEDPDKIIEDIKEGICDLCKTIVIPDRKLAIQKSLEIATQDDIVLIAGKGHECYQEINNQTIEFSDKATLMAMI